MIFFKVQCKSTIKKSKIIEFEYFYFYFNYKTEKLSFRTSKSGNEALAIALTEWIFKQRGVLRTKNVRHYLKKDKSTPSFYTIKNDIVSGMAKKKCK